MNWKIIGSLCVVLSLLLVVGCVQGNGAVAGQAIGTQSNPTCTDSDGGIEQYIKGQVTTNNNPDEVYFDNCGTNGIILAEKYCKQDNSVGVTELSCQNGCIDGACRNAPACVDTDNGIKYSVKGKATGFYNNLENYGTIADACCVPEQGGLCGIENGFPPYNLEEEYCEGSVIKETYYNCPNGCRNGACI